MIEGLKVTVPGTEVQQLLKARADHHRSRASDYRKTWQTLAQAMETLNDENAPKMSSSNSDPVASAKSGMERHENQALENDFMAKFIDISEAFLLDSSDLERLGVLHSRWG